MTNRVDRRRFLLGAGGAMLAIPMLEEFAPRKAFGQSAAPPPKRVVLLIHEHGRGVGNGQTYGGVRQDWWSPRTTTGALPAAGTAPSKMLQALAPIRDEIVTVDGVDNIIRHATGDGDGHAAPLRTLLTGRVFQSLTRAGGPSFDYFSGLRLRANDSMRPSIILPASATPMGYPYYGDHFWGANGSQPTAVSGNPRMAITDIFGAPVTTPPPTPAPPTLQERLQSNRKSILDGVLGSLNSLRGRVNAADRDRLDAHASFIRTIETSFTSSGTGIVKAMSCMRPDDQAPPQIIPSTQQEYDRLGRNPDWERGRQDALTLPYQIENLVQALACDVTRVASLDFFGDPTFASEFPNGTPFTGDGAWHETIHSSPVFDQATNCQNVYTGFQALGKGFTMLIQRLAEMQDTDGSRLLDNTLVLWISELGYGSEHVCYDIPIVLAGMRSAFPQGQGRHVVHNRRTLGDLFAHMLRMLGGTDTTYGEDGTLGAVAASHGVTNIMADFGKPGFVTKDTPLHMGPLDL